MKTTSNTLSKKRINRLRGQGFTNQSEEQLSEMAFGIRFAYRTCVIILTIAIITQSLPIFIAMLGISVLGIVLPNHPFDYVYNYVLSDRMRKPKLPPRAIQLKFTCGVATLWLGTVVYLMETDATPAALVMAGVLVVLAVLPSTIDICVPSVMFNVIFRNHKNETFTAESAGSVTKAIATNKSVKRAVVKSIVAVAIITSSISVNGQNFWATGISSYYKSVPSETVNQSTGVKIETVFNNYDAIMVDEVDEKLEIEKWMTDDMYFHVVNFEKEADNPLELQEWMTNKHFFRITDEKNKLLEDEERMAVENSTGR